MKEVSFCVYCGQVSTYPTHWVLYFLCLRIVKLKDYGYALQFDGSIDLIIQSVLSRPYFKYIFLCVLRIINPYSNSSNEIVLMNPVWILFSKTINSRRSQIQNMLRRCMICLHLFLFIWLYRCVFWTFTMFLALNNHTKPIHSVYWDPSRESLASVSDDSVRV